MSLLNGKAREVIDFCLSSESPQIRAKVYEIINLSGLDPSDPMFLILALTGQMRVFLEAAPADLSQLLSEWKTHNAQSLSEIDAAISLVKKTQQQQADAIAQNLSAVSSQCVSDIKEAGMATTSALSLANSETGEQVQQTKKQNEKLFEEIKILHAEFQADRQKNLKNMNAVIEWVGNTTQRQETVNEQIGHSISEIGKIQQNKIWLKIANVFWSFPALVVFGLICIGSTWWLASKRYNHPNNVFGRDIVDWNVERINHCRETQNPKCTFWIVPPGSPQRKE